MREEKPVARSSIVPVLGCIALMLFGLNFYRFLDRQFFSKWHGWCHHVHHEFFVGPHGADTYFFEFDPAERSLERAERALRRNLARAERDLARLQRELASSPGVRVRLERLREDIRIKRENLERLRDELRARQDRDQHRARCETRRRGERHRSIQFRMAP